ncbi:MAG: type I methionyl aminopeptidase [Deltaproteobacteria bacterium]|nr:type I methionyl aminopeptidase [Deltaproteobacteria bacterium]
MGSESIILKTSSEIESLRKSNLVVAEILQKLKAEVAPGITTMDLEKRCEEELKKVSGARPAFKGYRGFPACLCTSVNEEVVHGMPSDKKTLNSGDILSVDFGVELDGFYGDSAFTIKVGDITAETEKLVAVTEESLNKAIDAARVGNRLHDISHAVQGYVEAEGFSVVRAFVGHGIGRELHEAPQVPNFGKPGTGVRLKEGMVLAIEPMISVGTWDIKVLKDGWTAVTSDGKMSAHFEHSVAITKDGPYVLSRL